MPEGLHPLARLALAAAAPADGLPPGPEGEQLARLREAVGPDPARAFQEALAAPGDDPLLRLGQRMSLRGEELAAVALAMAVETAPLAGRLVAFLQEPEGGSRPTLGLLAHAAGALTGAPDLSPDALAASLAVRAGLLVLAQDGAPLPELAVAVPPHLVDALRGRPARRPGYRIGVDDAPPLPPSVHAEARRHAQALAASGRALLIRTGAPAEGRAAAAAVAAALQRTPLFIETDDLTGVAPWLVVSDLLPVFVRAPGPGERARVPALPGYAGPTLALAGPDGAVEIGGAPALAWRLPVPSAEERVALWSSALGEADLAGPLAAEHRHGAGRIAELGRLARQRAAMDGRPQPTRADVTAVAWLGDASGLDALAQPLPAPIADDALVLTPALRDDLGLLLARCRNRESLAQGLGTAARARYAPGVRALFVGPSGTGKTLAAGWLATRLGLPLYRVDVAAVTSKYIGETEKNLADLLARAEHAEVILLFDEADSLFGKRTDVKQSTDRFANSQTNYLLQRIESYEGITLLTSNSRSRFDAAFSRRLDLIVEFPLPGPEERRALWLAHLGPDHDVDQARLNQLAATVDVTGGHIRNAVLTAALLAQGAGRRIAWTDLLRGLALELRKLGQAFPSSLRDDGIR
ncbi:ATP-binding protein [Sorangium sp. So ce1024]|uniref:ATP-binding protein n=1 Tax=unclassified Sorangium TaxID=2621164 RepID=UPI003F050BD8